MTGGFADSAGRLFGSAAQHLGWSADLFWTSTPSEFLAAINPTRGLGPGGVSRDQLQTMMEREGDG